MAPSLVLAGRLEGACRIDPRDSVALRCRADPMDGLLRVVGVCRLVRNCSKRDSLCTREPVDGGFVGITDGIVILERDRVFKLRGDRVDGAVNDLERLSELFVDCLPIRLPILRERDSPADLWVLREGVGLGAGFG